MGTTSQKSESVQKTFKFINGGLAGMGATCCVQPLDVTKCRMQVSKPGEFASVTACVRHVLRTDGITGLYAGLQPGVLRQATYCTARMAIFTHLMDSDKERNGGQEPTFSKKVLYGLTAGGIGSFIGNPCDVALIRMASDSMRPVELRRNYTGVGNAFYRIVTEEGAGALMRGFGPTLTRAVIMNGAQLASYSQIKQTILEKQLAKDGLFCHFLAAMCSGFICAFTSAPADMIKSRIQNMKSGQYKNAVDCFTVTLKNEGVFALWKGFTPYYFRVGPHTVFTFIFFEQLNRLSKSML